MIVKLSPEEWSTFSQNAHAAMFSKVRPGSMDRIDYVLIVDVEGTLGGYITVQEVDAETVYWQFGGCFEWARNSLRVGRQYSELLRFQSKLARRIVTKVENTNLPTLRLHMANGFLIHGIQYWERRILVELIKEFENCHSLTRKEPQQLKRIPRSL